MDEKIKILLETSFKEIFDHDTSDGIFFAPGRVNLIGEHIDYNGGYVLPFAISNGTYGIVKKRKDLSFNMYSLNFKESGVISFTSDELYPRSDSRHKNLDWALYPAGMIYTAREYYNADISFGFDLLIYGNIPNGSGLSSSSSLDMLIGKIINDFYGLSLDGTKLSLLGQKAEHVFNGVNCGIMDQFAITNCKEKNALLLNTVTYEYEHIPFEMGDKYKLIVMNTNKVRKLSDSKYNERRAECEEGLAILNRFFGADKKYLCEYTLDDLRGAKNELPLTVYKRVKHVLTEQHRTIGAGVALKAGSFFTLVILMDESHESLRDDYEVTGAELDAIVDAARKTRARHPCSKRPVSSRGIHYRIKLSSCHLIIITKRLMRFIHQNREREKASGL